MKTSESLDKIAPDFAKAQATIGGAVKDADNPFFNSKYADLSSVWLACKESLHANGISVIQSPINDGDRIGVSTMLLHKSGQFITDSYTLSVKKNNDPQSDCSSVTYARRNALAAFVGVCPVDDDAEGAMDRKPANKPPPKRKPPAQKPASTNAPFPKIELNPEINYRNIAGVLADIKDNKLACEWLKIHKDDIVEALADTEYRDMLREDAKKRGFNK